MYTHICMYICIHTYIYKFVNFFFQIKNGRVTSFPSDLTKILFKLITYINHYTLSLDWYVCVRVHVLCISHDIRIHVLLNYKRTL